MDNKYCRLINQTVNHLIVRLCVGCTFQSHCDLSSPTDKLTEWDSLTSEWDWMSPSPTVLVTPRREPTDGREFLRYKMAWGKVNICGSEISAACNEGRLLRLLNARGLTPAARENFMNQDVARPRFSQIGKTGSDAWTTPIPSVVI
jgi:hypothetical protein